jgi:hypothetical protein
VAFVALAALAAFAALAAALVVSWRAAVKTAADSAAFPDTHCSGIAAPQQFLRAKRDTEQTAAAAIFKLLSRF